MEKENDQIDLRKYLKAIKQGKWWMVITMIIVIGLTTAYTVIKAPQFESNATILIENESEGGTTMPGMGAIMRTFSIGGFGKTAVDNEILIMQSHSLKKEMVNRLELNRTYIERNGLQKQILYKTSPIRIAAPKELFDTLQHGFKIKVQLKNGIANITATKGFFNTVLAEKKNAELPCTIETPFGNFQILKTNFYNPDESRNISVMIRGNHIVANSLGNKVLKIGYASKKADGMQLTILDESKERGRDILNTLMALYNERRNERRNETAEAEVAFLDGRIAQLSAQLSESEQKVTDFKIDNNMIDIGTEVSFLVGQDKSAYLETIKMDVERSLLNDILAQLKDPDKKYTLIPMAETLGETGAINVITTYNTLIMRRMEILKSAKEDNIVLKNINEQIDALRSSAINNVERILDNLQIKYASVTNEKNKHKGKLNSLPKYEQEYIDLKRDRELKNSLYIFLLEKRESALLKLNNTKELGFIFEPAYSEIKPDNSKKYLIGGIGLFAGIVLGLTLSICFGLRKNKTKKQ